MENNLSFRSFEIVVGCFEIKIHNIVIVDILPNNYTVGKYLDFLRPLGGREVESAISMVAELESRGIKVDDKIKKLIQSEFFSKSFTEALGRMSRRVAIVKGRTTDCRSPMVLIRDGFPSDFDLVPTEITFHLAYLISHFITKEFLNIHNMDRIFIMSNPLEKFDKNDDNLIIEWDPSYNKAISTTLYENSYSGDHNAGYLFFY